MTCKWHLLQLLLFSCNIHSSHHPIIHACWWTCICRIWSHLLLDVTPAVLYRQLVNLLSGPACHRRADPSRAQKDKHPAKVLNDPLIDRLQRQKLWVNGVASHILFLCRNRLFHVFCPSKWIGWRLPNETGPPEGNKTATTLAYWSLEQQDGRANISY